jgi:hypothetical protein
MRTVEDERHAVRRKEGVVLEVLQVNVATVVHVGNIVQQVGKKQPALRATVDREKTAIVDTDGDRSLRFFDEDTP